ncbi:hypothetical protein SLS60_006403 [Paraconiothyrium brasiliense]|uniref:Vanillate O-demethylase oxygenase-like C-terminal catalytic domain-containing protein n=1 Tax=Paraconiothyrium brasiliense TaxID=300254 RepID=A0ABR3RB14_9PLEO
MDLTEGNLDQLWNFLCPMIIGVKDNKCGGPAGFSAKPPVMFEWERFDLESPNGPLPIRVHHQEATKLGHHKHTSLPEPVQDKWFTLRDNAVDVVSPGRALIRIDKASDAMPGQFYIASIAEKKGQSPEPNKQPEGIMPKMFHVTLATMTGRNFWVFMRRAYALLNKGEIVQFHYHMHENRHYRNPREARSIMRQNPQLWPVTILRAMPEGTGLLMAPWSNGNEVVWSMTRDPLLTQTRINNYYAKLRHALNNAWLKHLYPRRQASASVDGRNESPTFMHNDMITLASAMDTVFDYQVQVVRRVLMGDERYSAEGRDFAKNLAELAPLVKGADRARGEETSFGQGRKHNPFFEEMMMRWDRTMKDPRSMLSRRGRRRGVQE